MKRFLVGSIILAWLAMSPPAYAGVSDWPVVGQVVRVGKCVVGGSADLLTSLLTHLTNWGSEAITTIGQCALNTTEQVADVVGDVVAVQIPTPDPVEPPVTP